MEIFEYYTFQQKLAIEKISEEIEFYENCEFSAAPFITDYVIYLKSRIGNTKYNSQVTCSIDKFGNKREIKKMNLDEYTKDMDMVTFDRPWNKLKELHKIMKINEFVDNLEYKSAKISPEKIAKNKQYLKTELIDGLKTKKFLKNKSVIEYDQHKICIVSITSVFYNKKNSKYEIDWSE